jgi:hypothetical protein
MKVVHQIDDRVEAARDDPASARVDLSGAGRKRQAAPRTDRQNARARQEHDASAIGGPPLPSITVARDKRVGVVAVCADNRRQTSASAASTARVVNSRASRV